MCMLRQLAQAPSPSPPLALLRSPSVSLSRLQCSASVPCLLASLLSPLPSLVRVTPFVDSSTTHIRTMHNSKQPQPTQKGTERDGTIPTLDSHLAAGLSLMYPLSSSLKVLRLPTLRITTMTLCSASFDRFSKSQKGKGCTEPDRTFELFVRLLACLDPF
ncbi:hypothetical protein BC826DRAFT_109145 [Russula brevipes]|nr:hypothetical protein BC826DRAFT_109145 [Russula brevipes]